MFENISVGDIVWLTTYEFNQTFWVPFKVQRVTKNIFSVQDGPETRFKKADGCVYGDQRRYSNFSSRAYKADPTKHDERKKSYMSYKSNLRKWVMLVKIKTAIQSLEFCSEMDYESMVETYNKISEILPNKTEIQ